MKKYLPLILLGVGVLIAVVAVFLVIKKAIEFLINFVSRKPSNR